MKIINAFHETERWTHQQHLQSPAVLVCHTGKYGCYRAMRLIKVKINHNICHVTRKERNHSHILDNISACCSSNLISLVVVLKLPEEEIMTLMLLAWPSGLWCYHHLQDKNSAFWSNFFLKFGYYETYREKKIKLSTLITWSSNSDINITCETKQKHAGVQSCQFWLLHSL